MRVFYIFLLLMPICIFCRCGSGSLAPESPGYHGHTIIISDPNSARSIQGHFPFQPDDRPDYAKREWDDSSWIQLPVPALWSSAGVQHEGIGWYRFHFRLTGAAGLKREDLSVLMPYTVGAHEVYVNGVLLGKGGIVADSYEDASFSNAVHLVRIPADLLDPVDNVLAVRVRSYANAGGIALPDFYIGKTAPVQNRLARYYIWNSLLAGVSLIVGLYNLALFFGHRNDRSFLYFGLAALMSFTYTLSGKTLDYFLHDSGNTSFLLHGCILQLSISCTPILILRFFENFFGISKRWYVELAALVSLSGGIVFPLSFASREVYRFHLEYLLPQVLGAGCLVFIYLIWMCLIFTRQKRFGSPIILVGVSLFFCAILNDILHHQLILKNTTRLYEEGFTGFTVVMGIVLGMKLNRTIRETERLNRSLDAQVLERTREIRSAYVELQAQDEAKTSFFTNISHEIRTPLTLLLSPIETMSREHLDETQRAQLLAVMRKNGRNLLKLVNDLLDLSRLEAGRSRFEPRSVNLTALVREVVSNFEQAARRGGLVMEFRSVGAHDVMAVLDAEKVEKSLFNLIGNALKFTRSGKIRVAVQAHSDGVQIRVEDTGVGIPAEQHDLIFERFRQADAGDDRRVEGTGIGLYIVRRFTELHGGTVRVESAPGVGSIFTLEFPQHAGAVVGRTDADALAPETLPGNPDFVGASLFEAEFLLPSELAAGSASATHGESVLIVEDNSDLREFLNSTFRSQYRVIAARDGREGLELARRFRPDAIVTDIMMPQVNGLELLQEIRSDPGLAETPVVLLTARAMIKDRMRGLAEMADDYVSKPFYVRELLLRVRNLLYRKRLRELAVARENQRIYADFHDHLGARLTDISILAGQLATRDDDERATRNALQGNVNILVENFRDCLAARDDMARLNENFVNGLHMILLRRYVNAGRQLHFSADFAAREFLVERIDESTRNTLHATCTELATNDIRYGAGPARWKIYLLEDILVVSLQAASDYDPARAPGHGIENVRERLTAIGGQFQNKLENGVYRARIQLSTAG